MKQALSHMFFTALEESLTSSILPAAFPMSAAVSATSSALSTVLPRSITSSALDATFTMAPPPVANEECITLLASSSK